MCWLGGQGCWFNPCCALFQIDEVLLLFGEERHVFFRAYGVFHVMIWKSCRKSLVFITEIKCYAVKTVLTNSICLPLIKCDFRHHIVCCIVSGTLLDCCSSGILLMMLLIWVMLNDVRPRPVNNSLLKYIVKCCCSHLKITFRAKCIDIWALCNVNLK